MQLEGTLDAFGLPDIFQLLSFTKKTGGLHLRRAGTRGTVHFATGAVTGASSDVARYALARRIAAAGIADDEALAAAVDRCAEDRETGFVRALHDSGAVEDGVLHGLIAEQAVDAVFDLLRWPDGEFTFIVGEANRDDLGLQLAVDEIVAEARRRLEAWQGHAESVPAPDVVPALAPNPSVEPTFSREEWALLGHVDGRRTVADIVALTGRGEYAVVTALAALVQRGLLLLRRPGDGDAPTALVRRLALLDRLDGGAPTPDADSGGTSIPRPAVAGDDAMPSSAEQAALPADDAAGPSALAGPRSAPYAGITPARAEPFLPRRAPDHPEDQLLNNPVVAQTVGRVEGSSAIAPMPTPYIEQDPGVNKGLLLRLIAGVRGL